MAKTCDGARVRGTVGSLSSLHVFFSHFAGVVVEYEYVVCSFSDTLKSFRLIFLEIVVTVS